MFIVSLGHYLPEIIVPNEYFEKINGLTNDWIVARTGIQTRRRASKDENTNTMALEAVKMAFNGLPFAIEEIDLIIGATYTPFDTIGTISVMAQRHFKLNNAINFTVSSACSSFVNAAEIAEGLFASGKATKALIIAADHNTGYSDDTNQVSGHLWGDAAVAAVITKEKQTDHDIEILKIITRGLGHIVQGPDGVNLKPLNGGLIMPHGRDVFIHACNYMAELTREIVASQQMTIDQINYLIPHQANIRIINNVAEQLNIDPSKIIINIDKYGNTGSASSAIGLSQNIHSMAANATIVITVFGGGYSAGAMLLKKY